MQNQTQIGHITKDDIVFRIFGISDVQGKNGGCWVWEDIGRQTGSRLGTGGGGGGSAGFLSCLSSNCTYFTAHQQRFPGRPTTR